MREVTAYEDDRGHIHKTKRDAATSNFIAQVQVIWGKLPDQRDRGDPVIIARIFAATGNDEVRAELAKAIAEFDSER